MGSSNSVMKQSLYSMLSKAHLESALSLAVLVRCHALVMHIVFLNSLHEPAGPTTHQQMLTVNRLQGKSFLLNKLAASDAGEGFCVSPSHRPCTKGIWIWSELIERKAPNGSTYHVVLLDTEGIDAFGACLPLAALHSVTLCS